jgi:hypothetical protein
VCTSSVPHTCHMPCPCHSSWYDHPDIWQEHNSWTSSLCNLQHSPLTSSTFAQIFSSTRYSQTHKPMFLPQRERPVFTPIQNKKQIMVMYILIFIFLDRKLEDINSLIPLLQLVLNFFMIGMLIC